ncbi:hypothetical protein LOTGIDRAFT_178560 [Lottia gigantea]|uniref:Uncharacterized protein n=1 Tax=Lottia gigantea TaxID=225164 RepID=V4BWI9_LOTGI|nr:hypothetical protein LOTGIDRAFT_178560 [Lottia gigantea]ESO93354.1 hypothetical protein LOTGIDRAFT_178560 [Lottia gigantea]
MFPDEPDERGLKWRRELTSKYPKCYYMQYGPILPSVCLNAPETVKILLKTAEPKGRLYEFLRPWLGDGLLLSNGQKWARNRRLLTPAFHFDKLKSYLDIKNNAANAFCENLNDFAATGEYIDICQPVTMFTLDVILKCVFSYETKCQSTGENHPYVKAVSELSKILIRRFMKPWLHNDWIFSLTKDGKDFKKYCDYVHEIASDIISKRRLNLEQQMSHQKKYHDFLDILLRARDENNVGLTDREIRDEVDTFLFEGHDTTASGIYWTLFSIAQNQEIQKTLQKEVDSLLAMKNTDDLSPTDLTKLPYLSMCIKESLRLHNVVSFIIRQTQQDYIIDEKLLPKDTTASILIYNVHHNPVYWTDSLIFNPDRFLPEKMEKMNPFAHVPFSAGPRNCIGQNFALHEMKVALVKVLNRFSIELDLDHSVEKIESVIMRAKYGIKIKVIKR